MEVFINADYRADDIATVPVLDLVHYVLDAQACNPNTEVCISFVDNDEIASLNSEFRGKSGPTDVLSFECDGADSDDDGFHFTPPESTDGCASVADAVFELGDVIIAVDFADAQTKTFGTTFAGEISLLVVHGLLHLCGYDHIEDEEASVMEAREAEILCGWAKKQNWDLSVFGQFNGSGALIRGEH